MNYDFLKLGDKMVSKKIGFQKNCRNWISDKDIRMKRKYKINPQLSDYKKNTITGTTNEIWGPWNFIILKQGRKK